MFSDLLNPDPIPRMIRQIVGQRHRQLVARSCHDRAVEADALRRIDGLLDGMYDIYVRRGILPRQPS